jgi:hypothetical protein
VPEYKTFDDLFYGAWKEVLAPKNMLLKILRPKFEELGIQLTDEQFDHIVEQIEQGTNPIDLGLDDKQYLSAGISSSAESRYTLTIDLSDQIERLDKLEKRLPEIVAETFSELSEQWATELYQNIEDTRAERLKEEREERETFRSAVWRIWGRALDSLDVLINLVTEAGGDFASEYHPSDSEPDFKFEALIGLHARACQIAKEVFTLLSEGFADGAHARWRSLHEVTVVSKFIFDHDQGLAERYLLYHVVEARKGAYEHKKHAGRLNEPPPTPDELQQLDNDYEALRKRFGESYLKSYGWAATLLSPKPPNFANIEEKANLDHLRPYYKLASYNVHASAQGILFRLGADPNSSLLVAGPSVFGLADPGHGTALSLLWVTTYLLTYQPSMDRIVRLNVLLKLTDQVGEAFYQAHGSLMGDEVETKSDE